MPTFVRQKNLIRFFGSGFLDLFHSRPEGGGEGSPVFLIQGKAARGLIAC